MNDTLTIATWNLNRPAPLPNVRTETQLARIQEVDADIWVLTETSEHVVLPGYHQLATPATALRRPGERTTIIWSRWPLREVAVFPDLPEREELPRTWPSYTVSSRDTSPAVCAIVERPGSPLLVYGTVITYFGDRGPWGTSSYNQEQYKAVEAHADDWRRLRAAHRALPFIVAGDFDATCDGRNYPRKETCDALRSALVRAELDCLSAAHWIDHICVSTEHHAHSLVEVNHPEYHSPWAGTTVKLSDHHMVVAKVTLSGDHPGQ